MANSVRFGKESGNVTLELEETLLAEFLKSCSWVLYYFINELERGSEARANECIDDKV